MRLLLTEKLPLRKMTELGGFAEDGVLPERYGDLRKTRFKCKRISSTKFAAANHPMEITRAFVGNLETKTFAFKTESAGDGRNFTVVVFNAPVPIGTEVTASGIGKRHPITGALMENPAEILTDLMAIGGRNDAWWGQIRSEASVESVVLAGSIPGTLTDPTLRDVIDAIVDSAGGIWCPGMARLYPVPFDGFKIDLNVFNAQNVKVSASLTDAFDILKVGFDYDEAEGRNQGFLQLEASPQRYGGVPADLSLPMVRSAAVAEKIGRRVLSRGAGERYDVELDTDASEFVRPGTWALLSDHPQWLFEANPYLMPTGVTINRLEKRAHVLSEAILSTPTITLTKHSIGSNSISNTGIEVADRNGVATFLVRDPNGRAFPGVYVSLDGAVPKKTDGAGQVSFTYTQGGVHQLDVSMPGFGSESLEVTLLGTG